MTRDPSAQAQEVPAGTDRKDARPRNPFALAVGICSAFWVAVFYVADYVMRVAL